MKKYLISFIVLAIVTVMFAGCVNQSSTHTPKYNTGDVVSVIESGNWGMYIVKYNPVTDTYSTRDVNKYSGQGQWQWSDPPSKGDFLADREKVETNAPYKIDYISDLNIIKPAVTQYQPRTIPPTVVTMYQPRTITTPIYRGPQ